MALETGTFISDLNTANPTGSDALAFADDHLRLIKSTIKATFPSITGAVTKTHTQLNNALDKTGDTMTGLLTLSGVPTADLHASTKKYVDDAIAAAVAAAKAAQYPVGSIYTNATNPANPSTLLGFGTWVAFGAGRVPVGFDSTDPLFDSAEETGGSKDAVVVSHTHTATVTDPGHDHSVKVDDIFETQPSGYTNGIRTTGTTTNAYINSATTGITVSNSTSGVSGTNQNLQPYITVYMWKRTA